MVRGGNRNALSAASGAVAGRAVLGKGKWPVCFERAKKVVAQVLMHILPAALFDDTVQMKGEGSGLTFPETEASKETGQATGALTSTGALPDHVYRYDPLYLNWYISRDNGTSWFGPFASGNETFVTLAEPDCSPAFRTVLKLATQNGGATDADGCWTDTWQSFSSGGLPANVQAWSDASNSYSRPLCYYGSLPNSPPLATTAAGLLAGDGDNSHPGNGKCTAWADLLAQCLAANGVTDADQVRVEPDYYGPLADFYVATCNEWSLTPENDPYDPVWQWEIGEFEQDNPYVPGQNSPQPTLTRFMNHEIVKRGNGWYYDPSYGFVAADLRTYTFGAVGAFQNTTFPGPYSRWAPPSDTLLLH